MTSTTAAIRRLPSSIRGQVKGGAAVAAGEVVTRHPQRVAVERPVFTPVNMNRMCEMVEVRLRRVAHPNLSNKVGAPSFTSF